MNTIKVLSLEKKLCLNFCPYYKPSKDTSLTCRGFSVIEQLIKEGKKITFQKSDKALHRATEKVLVHSMCVTCPFYAEDCDFIQNRGNSPPCGGFTLLGHLLESDIIALDDIVSNIK